jgi:hypothetical protein
MKEELEVIEFEWDGPYTVDRVIAEMHRPMDYGVYQLYGTHNVLGPDSLLYIGQSQGRPFGQRIREHRGEWIEWEPSVVEVYVGRLGGIEPMSEERWPYWNNCIDRAERLLLYFCAPPYNSKGLKYPGEMPPTLVINCKRKHRLPLEVSTLLLTSSIGNADWKVYGIEQMPI